MHTNPPLFGRNLPILGRSLQICGTAAPQTQSGKTFRILVSFFLTCILVKTTQEVISEVLTAKLSTYYMSYIGVKGFNNLLTCSSQAPYLQ